MKKHTLIRRAKSSWKYTGLSGEYIDNIPTCGVVEMYFDSNWWDRIGDARPNHFDFNSPINTRPDN